MKSSLPRVGISSDVNTLRGDSLHCVGEQYIGAVVHAAGAVPYLLPCLPAGAQMASLADVICADDLLDGVDGLFLTGSVSNVAPCFYASDAEGVGPFDTQRDRTTLALLAAAFARDLPVFAVCRGFQEFNVACGGTLHAAVHENARFADHRHGSVQPPAARYQPAHEVDLVEDGVLDRLAGARTVRVNSFHGQGVDRLGESLRVEAISPDGLIEAARRPDRRFALGVQWHPEWNFRDNAFSAALFAAFGEAMRDGRAT